MAKLIDLTGQKFDKLTVIEKAQSRHRHVYWKCICDCGRQCEISGESLRRTNQSHNCGYCQTLAAKKEEKKNYLIGQKFGKLTVLKRLNKSNNSGVFWLCQCQCGNFKEVPTSLLTSGHTKSCGCLKLSSHLKDITGKKFGKLTALYFLPGQKKWHCKCDCGKEVDVISYLLRTLKTQSCGCINYSIGEKNIIKILSQNNIDFIKEYSFDNLRNNKTNRAYRFDFAIFEKNNLIRLIEFDGEQHFNQNRGTWKNHESFQKVKERDLIKNKYALDHDIPLVRIPYWERDNITLDLILGDKYLIKKEKWVLP